MTLSYMTNYILTVSTMTRADPDAEILAMVVVDEYQGKVGMERPSTRFYTQMRAM